MLARRNILVLHTGALGDFVLVWPLVMTLARIFPQSRVTVVTHASKGALAEAALRVESSDIESGWQGLFADDGQPQGRARKLIEGAQSIYSFISNPNLKRWGGDVPVIAIPPRPPPEWKRHASEFLAEQVRDVPVLGVAITQMLASIGDRGLGIAGAADGPVLIHPGSGSPEKNWPRDNFIQLARRLRESGRDVHIILGEVELEKWTPREIEEFQAVAQVHRPETYLALYQHLRTASLVIANDSGPGHLTGIMGLKTLCLFGPTDPAVWKPLGPRVRVLQKESLNTLSLDEVYDAAQ